MSALPDQGYEAGYGYDPGYPQGADDPDGPLDVETAVLRRLVEWLAALHFQHTGDGAVFAFARVVDEWPDDEQELQGYPTACVLVSGEANDEPYSLTPISMGQKDGYTLFGVATKRVPIQVDIWCRDRAQRQDVARTLDNERAPSEGTGSLVLALPRYWNLNARYNWLRCRRWDDAGSVRQGDFRLTWTIEAFCPVVRAVERPAMNAQLHPDSEIGLNVEVS